MVELFGIPKKPTYKILANGTDITATLQNNSASISLEDEANEEADQLCITVEGAIARPQADDTLELWMGYGLTLVYFGSFVVQETTKDDDYTLTVKATGVNFSSALKVKREITYEKVTIKDICTQIAKRHDLKLKCDYDDITIKSLSQDKESDIHFLNRVAGEYNAIFNIKNRTLIFLHRIKDGKASNELPRYMVHKNDVHNLTITHSKKALYNSCKCCWHCTIDNIKKEVIVGDGDPSIVHYGQFKDEAEAAAKATALLEKTKGCHVGGSFEIDGAVMYAGGVVELVGTVDDDGEYSIKRISHTIDSSNGWVTWAEITR
ncbi:MAG TPA: phage tail protein [Sulfurovum sp. UBA12169]|nr:MAG TPA: phage tail protein [Sulfurovum sp. UBA12169]